MTERVRLNDKPNGHRTRLKHPGGRPTLYHPSYAKQAAKLCKLGATDADLADFFEVTIATITNWKIRHEEFLVSIKLGKDEPDEFVNRSLYQRARGYTFDTLKIVYDKDLGKFVEHPHREHVPPDTTACIFWLKNRQPQLWRDKHELEHTGKDGDLIVNITAGMTDQQAERVYQDTIHRVRLNGNGAAK